MTSILLFDEFVGVVAQQAPNVKARPNKLTDEDHIRRAKKADEVAETLRGLWNIRHATRMTAFHFWKNGPVFGYTPVCSDGDRYGFTEEPEQLRPALVGCGRCAGPRPRTRSLRPHRRGSPRRGPGSRPAGRGSA